MTATNIQSWRVKITGLSPHVSTFDLSKDLNVANNRVIIPKNQHRSNHIYAWVVDFESEQYAEKFASHWNQKCLYEQDQIKFQASKSPDAKLPQNSNNTSKFSDNLLDRTTSIEHQESKNLDHRKRNRNYHSPMGMY